MDFDLIRSVALTTVGAGVLALALVRALNRRATPRQTLSYVLIGVGTLGVGLLPALWGPGLAATTLGVLLTATERSKAAR